MNKADLLYAFAAIAIATAANSNAAVIYRCKTYSDGTYLSNEVCSKSKGVIVDMAHVPDNMPFKEQAAMAEKIFNQKAAKQRADNLQRARTTECRAIDDELKEIWQQYEGGKYVPANQVGKDRTRTLELKSRRSTLACQSK